METLLALRLIGIACFILSVCMVVFEVHKIFSSESLSFHFSLTAYLFSILVPEDSILGRVGIILSGIGSACVIASFTLDIFVIIAGTFIGSVILVVGTCAVYLYIRREIF